MKKVTQKKQESDVKVESVELRINLEDRFESSQRDGEPAGDDENHGGDLHLSLEVSGSISRRQLAELAIEELKKVK